MKNERLKKIRPFLSLALSGCILLVAIAIPVYAWFSSQYELATYIPLSSPEALYIGAGHTDIDNDQFEDIRYMYFNGMDVTNESHYTDRVFSVYGKSISGFRLQLAYTTNNQFYYDIFPASESTVYSATAVPYTVHDGSNTTYYYSVAGERLAGSYLNRTEVDGTVLASDAYHTDTYGSYSRSNVNDYAEPIYWQTTNVETANIRGSFVKYYILRVHTEAKTMNDRETDVLCIAAKSFSLLQS